VRWALAMSWLIVALMVVASLAGLAVGHLYADAAWGREALRGGDLVTLALVVPVFAVTLARVGHGSARARAVWMGLLAYGVYDYAYYVFGARFNDIFLLHITLFSLSVFALATALPVIARGPDAHMCRPRAARWGGAFLVVVGLLQGALWLFVLIRNAVTGELIAHVPVAGQHLVFALDLSLLVPSLIVAGVLLARRRPSGYVFGVAMAVMGAAYQVNLLVSGAFQAHAHVAGASAFPVAGVALTAAFLATSAALLRRRSAG